MRKVEKVKDNLKLILELLNNEDDVQVKGLLRESLEALDGIEEAGKTVTAKEISKRYGVASSTVRMAILQNRLPAKKSGKIWLINEADAERLFGAGAGAENIQMQEAIEKAESLISCYNEMPEDAKEHLANLIKSNLK